MSDGDSWYGVCYNQLVVYECILLSGARAMWFKIGVKQKLTIIFFIFFLIFSGTVSILLFNLQKMVTTSQNIVSKNNKIDAISDILLTSIVDMEANHKKLNLLKKERYSEYFKQAKNRFEDALDQALELSSTSSEKKPWQDLAISYKRHKSEQWDNDTVPEIGKNWVSEKIVSNWMNIINQIKRTNQNEIASSLNDLNERSKASAKNGFYGFCISILVGFTGIWFISRSIFTPLGVLAEGLKRIAINKHHTPISLKGGDEFNELAKAYNEMSRQLYEEENIRTEFIATLSHEIRTPLSSIHESVNMIIEEVFGPINGKQAKFLRIANVEIIRINKLLNHLLNTSVLEADSRKINSTNINTKELVLGSAEIFVSQAEKKNITLKVNAIKQGPDLFGVKEELQQIFINIIGNAIKYSPDRGKVIISYRKKPKKGLLQFQVSDTGPGIPEDELSLVFSKYYRTKKVRGHLDGVGLGLAISKKIVTSYGGIITVSNNKDVGCTFSFTLPTQPSKLYT